MTSAIVISASSDIGAVLCKSWKGKGWDVTGTYRTLSPLVTELQETHQVPLHHCDLLDSQSIQTASEQLPQWDVLVFAPGRMDPIGRFETVPFTRWNQGVEVNFLRPLEMLHKLLPKRNSKKTTVLFFAGSGTNNAPTCYSSYSVSKIALIKMCELLGAEISDTRFVIVGPGWVKTKIHQETLYAGEAAGTNFQKTYEKLQGTDWVSMERVVDCCTYFATTDCNAISGRNFSTAFDSWDTPSLEEALSNNPNMYKLRRHQNDWTSCY